MMVYLEHAQKILTVLPGNKFQHLLLVFPYPSGKKEYPSVRSSPSPTSALNNVSVKNSMSRFSWASKSDTSFTICLSPRTFWVPRVIFLFLLAVWFDSDFPVVHWWETRAIFLFLFAVRFDSGLLEVLSWVPRVIFLFLFAVWFDFFFFDLTPRYQ